MTPELDSGHGHDPGRPCACPPPPQDRDVSGPGTLAYRLGTHGTFLAELRTALARSGTDAGRALATRGPDDLSMALLDGWAAAADVFTFYQERIANEGYLRSATERRSVLELARAIGYELNPGVAAETRLAFTADATGPPVVPVATGTRVQSIPGPGEDAQTFETVEDLEARPAWNRMPARATRDATTREGQTELWLQGVQTQLRRGDVLLLVGDERGASDTSDRWNHRTVRTVEEHPRLDKTRVVLTEPLSAPGGHDPLATNVRVHALRLRTAVHGHNAPDWNALPTDVRLEADGGDTIAMALAERQFTLVDRGVSFSSNLSDLVTGGHAVAVPAIPDLSTDWPGFEDVVGTGPTVDLDGEHPEVVPGGWIVLERPGAAHLYRIEDATTCNVARFTLTGKVTRVTLDTGHGTGSFFGQRRSTVVHAASEELALAPPPLREPVTGVDLNLDHSVPDLPRGRVVLVTGHRLRVQATRTGLPFAPRDGDERDLALHEELEVVAPPPDGVDATGTWTLLDRDGTQGTVHVPSGSPDALRVLPPPPETPLVDPEQPAPAGPERIVEQVTVDASTTDAFRTTLRLENPGLTHAYDPATLRVLANTAAATHGETVQDILGGGTTLGLKRKPLTHVPADTPTGGRSTLTLRVGDLEWRHEDALHHLGPGDEAFTTRIDDDGTVRLHTGDGRRGARIPSGVTNVLATYRVGTGAAGEVPADALTLLKDRPLGLRGVTNPVPATGAGEPEALEDARANAPLRVLTLDRVVTARDHEDLARAFAGIGKARADVLWLGQSRIVHLTVAPERQGSLSDTLRDRLEAAVRAAGDGGRRFEIDGCETVPFVVHGRVRVDPRHDAETVRAAAEAALRDALAYEHRVLARPVTVGEVVTVLHGVPGVVYVDVDALDHDVPRPARKPVLGAAPARVDDGRTLPAQLLVLADDGVRLEVVP